MANTLQTNNQNPQTTALTPSAQKQQGTGYTNLQSILNANNGSALGQNLTNNVNQNVASTVGNIQGANNQFGQQTSAEQNRISQLQGGAQNALNQVINAPGTTQANANLVNPNDVSAYTNYNNTSYQGPQGISNLSGLQNQQTNSQNYAGLLGSQGGQQQLLRTFVNQPNYTNSEQNLDSLILGTQPIQNNLKQARSQALQQLSQNNVNNLNTSAQQQAQLNAQALGQGQQQLQQQTANTTQGINSAIQSQLAGLRGITKQQTDEYNNLNTGNYNAAVDANGNPILSPQQVAILTSQAAKSGLINPQSYFSQTNGGGYDLTNAGAANNTQAAQLAALAQLTGNSGLALVPGQGNSIGDALAGQTNIAGNIVTNAQGLANPYLTTTSLNDILSKMAPGAGEVTTPVANTGGVATGILSLFNPFAAAANYVANEHAPTTTFNAGNLTPAQAQAFSDLLSVPGNGGKTIQQLENAGQYQLGKLGQPATPTPASGSDISTIQQFINTYFGLGANSAAPNTNPGGVNVATPSGTEVTKQ